MRQVVPDAKLDWDLCRNAVLACRAPPLQRQVAEQAIPRVRAAGALVIGIHESPPDDLSEITP